MSVYLQVLLGCLSAWALIQLLGLRIVRWASRTDLNELKLAGRREIAQAVVDGLEARDARAWARRGRHEAQ